MSKEHSRHPLEWFGFSLDNTSEEAQISRNNRLCPFMQEVEGQTSTPCVKRSRLLPDHPFGVCSVEYPPYGIMALCPYRFLEEGRVFRNIAEHYFGDLHNLVLFSEVSFPSSRHLGRFDYVIVQHAPLSRRVTDFVAVEFQAAQTTSTGHLVQAVKDYLQGSDVTKRTYPFGINWADIWKRAFIQVLLKGMALEYWGKALYWVVQEAVYRNLAQRYKLPLPDEKLRSSEKAVRFALYTLQQGEGRASLQGPKWLSFDVDELFQALRYNVPLPDRNRIQEHLQNLLQKATISQQLRWL